MKCGSVPGADGMESGRTSLLSAPGKLKRASVHSLQQGLTSQIAVMTPYQFKKKKAELKHCQYSMIVRSAQGVIQ